MSTKAFYAGSFDPITNGHLDIIERAAHMFDKLVVGVGINPKKPGLFDAAERLALVVSACHKIKNIEVTEYHGLTSSCASALKCGVIVRGLRDAQDFGYEMQMAHMNRHLNAKLETVFIPTFQQFSQVSSSLVKEVASLGGDVSGLVPPIVARALEKKLRSQEAKPRARSRK